MPSTADDVLAEIRSAALRAATVRLRRNGLDSLRVMGQWHYAYMGLRKCLNANRGWHLADQEVFLNQWVKCLISKWIGKALVYLLLGAAPDWRG